MIRSVFCPSGGTLQLNLDLGQIAQALEERTGLLWVSLEQPAPDEMRSVLHDLFHFHPLAIEDCASVGYQAPKVDNFGEYLFLVVHALRSNCSFDRIELIEFDCFLGHNYLVTSFMSPEMPPVQAVWSRLQRDERLYRQGADFLCYTLLDDLVDRYMPLIDSMDEEIDQLEDQVLVQPQPHTLQRILALKHGIMTLRRIIIPEREVLNRLSRDDLPQIARQQRIYYRDIYDHLVRVHDLSESVRDVVTSALEAYLSVVSNRLNEVMKALTIVSTIFLPLSFVAGVYGMNFHHMPELRWPWGYPLVLGIFGTIAGGMLWFFKRRGWI